MKASNPLSLLFLIFIGCGNNPDPEATDPDIAESKLMPHENRVILKKVMLRLKKGQEIEDGLELASLNGKVDASIDAIKRLEDECEELLAGLLSRDEIQETDNDGLTALVSLAFLSTTNAFLERQLKDMGGDSPLPSKSSNHVSLEEVISKINKLLDE